MDPAEYLADGYDISKLTVPKLRSILVEHQVSYTSNATKPELLELFKNEILPHKKEILKMYSAEGSSPEIAVNRSEKHEGNDKNGTPDLKKGKEVTDDAPLKVDEPETHGNLKSGSDILEKESLHRNASNNSNIITEPLNLSDTEKTIPSKRSSENSSATPKKLKKSKKRGTKAMSESPNTSSKNKSYLGIDLEIDENENIFNLPIQANEYNSPTQKRSIKSVLKDFDTSMKEESEDLSDLVGNDLLESLRSARTPANHILADKVEVASERKDKIPQNTSKELPKALEEEINNSALLNELLDTSKILSGPTKNIKSSPASSKTEISENTTDEKEDITEDIEESEKKAQYKKTTITEETVTVSGSDATYEKEDIVITENALDDDEYEDITSELSEEAQEMKSGTVAQRSNPFFSIILNFILVLNIMIPYFIIYCCREIQLNVGYCGIENPNKLLNLWEKIPADMRNRFGGYQPYVEKFEDSLLNTLSFPCHECPSNAKCGLNTIECDHHYIKKQPYGSIFGLIPLMEYCELDQLSEERDHYFQQYIYNYLQDQENGILQMNELHDYLKLSKPSSITDEEFEEFWKNFIKQEEQDEKKFEFNFKTNEITLSHKTPTEYYTKPFANAHLEKRSKRLFEKNPPTGEFKKYHTNS